MLARVSAARRTEQVRAARGRTTDLVGEPPKAYLTGRRLDMAADLLRDSDAAVGAVGAVARQVGYGSTTSTPEPCGSTRSAVFAMRAICARRFTGMANGMTSCSWRSCTTIPDQPGQQAHDLEWGPLADRSVGRPGQLSAVHLRWLPRPQSSVPWDRDRRAASYQIRLVDAH